MKKILIGTTNPSKVELYHNYLKDYEIEIYTLSDLNIMTSPKETGNTPEENAQIKARYYGQFFELVICGDSGLYFLDYDLNDAIQPGLNVRRVNGKELSDEEMISYYSDVARQHGGKLLASYVNGIAVYHHGEIDSYMEYGPINRYHAFYLHDHQVDDYTPGWPLDSLSDRLGFDCEDITKEKEAYQERVKQFLINSLGLHL